MNWKELKGFCNGLTEEQLEQKVIMWREDEVINKIEPITLEEDQYINIEYPETGCMDESEMMSQSESNEELTKKHFSKVYDNVFPLLREDF